MTEQKKWKNAILTIGYVALLLCFVRGCYWYEYTYIPAQAAKIHIEKAKAAARERLTDPDSALFRNVRSDGHLTCGEINGKNKMGGYAGYVPFLVIGEGVVVNIDAEDEPIKIAKLQCDKDYNDEIK